jgi:hypothetical protein
MRRRKLVTQFPPQIDRPTDRQTDIDTTGTWRQSGSQSRAGCREDNLRRDHGGEEYAVARLTESLRYKPEGHGFDSRWCHGDFHWFNPSARTTALGWTQPLTGMSTRDISWGQRQPVRRADNLTTFICRMSRNSGSLKFLEPLGPAQACYGIALPRKDGPFVK